MSTTTPTTTAAATPTATPPAVTADELAGRVFEAALGTIDVFSIYLGDRLGWYRSLATDGPATPGELAERTHCDPRYAREWLEQQAVTGLVVSRDGRPHRFELSSAGVEVFTDPHSLSYLAPLARMLIAMAVQAPALLAAYRDGSGVSWARFGDEARAAQAEMNRPWFDRELAGALRSIPDLDARLATASIADVGCGAGWSTLALARAYPGAELAGYDIDGPSIELARANLAAHPDLADRVSFTQAAAASLPGSRFDAVFAFECVHDLPRPVEALAAARRSLRADGPVIVMDEAVAEEFTAPGDDVERLMYGFSLGVCLPDGLSSPPSAGTGTVMRADILREYAAQAGFASVEVLPVDGFGFWRFYRLS